MKASVVTSLRRPKAKFKNELGIPFDGDRAIGVTDALIVLFCRQFVSFLLAHEAQISSH